MDLYRRRGERRFSHSDRTSFLVGFFLFFFDVARFTSVFMQDRWSLVSALLIVFSISWLNMLGMCYSRLRVITVTLRNLCPLPCSVYIPPYYVIADRRLQ